MTTSFVLELDTTAPVLTFGAATAEPEAGFELQVAYALDDGAVTAAQIRNGSVALPMRVDPGLLSLVLPSDWPDGDATISAVAVDDVGNAHTYAMTLSVSGVIAPTPTPTPPAPPGWGGPPPPRPTPQHRRARHAGRARARTSVHVLRRTPAPRTRAVAATRAKHQVRHVGSSLATARSAARMGARHAPAAAALAHSATTVRRADPDAEALLLLGIL